MEAMKNNQMEIKYWKIQYQKCRLHYTHLTERACGKEIVCRNETYHSKLPKLKNEEEKTKLKRAES